jgi:hypothetical protein
MVEMSHSELKVIAKGLCKDALNGDLSLEKFYELWPDSANKDPFLKQVYDDIEDGTEHIPSFWFTKGINFKAWENSLSFFILSVDYILLGYSEDSSDLLDCRKHIIWTPDIPIETLEKQIMDCFKKQ